MDFNGSADDLMGELIVSHDSPQRHRGHREGAIIRGCAEVGCECCTEQAWLRSAKTQDSVFPERWEAIVGRAVRIFRGWVERLRTSYFDRSFIGELGQAL